jgi:hypothetical protein
MEQLTIPSIALPESPILPSFQFKIPEGTTPSYIPLVVPPSDLQRPDGVEASDEEKAEQAAQPKQLPKIDIPFTNRQMPVPEQEILVTAGTTAAVSVAATLTATAVFKHVVSIMKPIIKQLVTRIQKKLNGKGRTE